jgi:hypothetical protein
VAALWEEEEGKEEEEEVGVSCCVFSLSCPRLFLPRSSVCVGRVLCVLSLLSVFLLVFSPSLSLLSHHLIWTTRSIAKEEEEEEEEEESLKV